MTNPPVDPIQTHLLYAIHAVVAVFAFGVAALWVQVLPRLLGVVL